MEDTPPSSTKEAPSLKDLKLEREQESLSYRGAKDVDKERAFKAIRRVFTLDAQIRERERSEAQQTSQKNEAEPGAGYQGEHTAPMRDSGAALSDLKGIYPDDFYGPDGARLYGQGDGQDSRSINIARTFKGRPRAKVTVYRAIPKDISTHIKGGDWVTLDMAYAKAHGRENLNGNYKIIRKTVQASDLFTNGDSLMEWGYDPKEPPKQSSAPSEATSNGVIKEVLCSFAGEAAKTADLAGLNLARERILQGDDRKDVLKDTGWCVGADGRWRFEIDDSDASLSNAIQSLANGGYEAKAIDSVSYCVNDDGTYDITLNPPNPQTTRSFISLVGVDREVVRAVVPDELFESILKNEGQEDYVGAFKDAKRIAHHFDFQGFDALPLNHVLHHPALFSAYPSLKDVMVQINPKLGIGAEMCYVKNESDNETTVIRLGSGQKLSSLLHEIQHAIQGIEGFAMGGTMKTNNDSLPAEVVDKIKALGEKADELGLQSRFDEARSIRMEMSDLRKESGYRQYRNLAGEVEARNSQKRQTMTSGERLKTHYSETADTQDHKVIIVFGGEDVGATLMSNLPQYSSSSESTPLNYFGGLPNISIRSSIKDAYGNLFDKLEKNGAVELMDTQYDAIRHAAQDRASMSGNTLIDELKHLHESLKLPWQYSQKTHIFPKRIQAFFDPILEKSFLIAENLDPQCAPGVLMHEVGIHMSNQDAMQSVYNRAVEILAENGGDPFIDNVIKRLQDAEEDSPEESAAYLVEEYELYRTSAPPSVTQWFEDFKSGVRAWLFNQGVIIEASDLTVSDIAAIARSNATVLSKIESKHGDDTNSKQKNYFYGQCPPTKPRL